jgi:hypothetical protein
LSSGDNFAIPDKGCGTIVIKGRYSQNIHNIIIKCTY